MLAVPPRVGPRRPRRARAGSPSTGATTGRPRRSSRGGRPIIRSWPGSAAGSPWRIATDRPPCGISAPLTPPEPDDRDTVFGLGTALALVGDHAAAAPFLRDSKAYDTRVALYCAADPANRKDPASACPRGRVRGGPPLPEARAWITWRSGPIH